MGGWWIYCIRMHTSSRLNGFDIVHIPRQSSYMGTEGHEHPSIDGIYYPRYAWQSKLIILCSFIFFKSYMNRFFCVKGFFYEQLILVETIAMAVGILWLPATVLYRIWWIIFLRSSVLVWSSPPCLANISSGCNKQVVHDIIIISNRTIQEKIIVTRAYGIVRVLVCCAFHICSVTNGTWRETYYSTLQDGGFLIIFWTEKEREKGISHRSQPHKTIS